MCVRLCDIHSRFRRVTFKKLRSAPPIGNKSPYGIFVSRVVVATHTNKTQKNMFKHDTAPATPNISFSTKYNGDSFIVYDVFVFYCPKCWPPVKNISWERAKKKEKKNTKRIITYAWQQVDRFRKVTDPPYADWYILIMKYLRSRCAKPSHRKYYIRCDIIFSLSFFNFFLL